MSEEDYLIQQMALLSMGGGAPVPVMAYAPQQYTYATPTAVPVTAYAPLQQYTYAAPTAVPAYAQQQYAAQQQAAYAQQQYAAQQQTAALLSSSNNTFFSPRTRKSKSSRSRCSSHSSPSIVSFNSGDTVGSAVPAVLQAQVDHGDVQYQMLSIDPGVRHGHVLSPKKKHRIRTKDQRAGAPHQMCLFTSNSHSHKKKGRSRKKHVMYETEIREKSPRGLSQEEQIGLALTQESILAERLEATQRNHTYGSRRQHAYETERAHRRFGETLRDLDLDIKGTAVSLDSSYGFIKKMRGIPEHAAYVQQYDTDCGAPDDGSDTTDSDYDYDFDCGDHENDYDDDDSGLRLR